MLRYAYFLGAGKRWPRIQDEESGNAGFPGLVDTGCAPLGHFHQQVPAAPADSEWGSPASIGATAGRAIEALARLATDSTSQQALARLRAWDAAQRQRLGAVFAKRKRAGMVALVDAVSLAPALRQPFARYANRARVPFLIFGMRASLSVMARRLTERADAAEDASDADAEVLARQHAHACALPETEMKRRIAVDTGASLSAADHARVCEPLKAMPGILCSR